jgi:hypothetical protein
MELQYFLSGAGFLNIILSDFRLQRNSIFSIVNIMYVNIK